MLHIVLHFAIPLVAALVFYRTHWREAVIIMVATMVVDVDHLLADPIYDPARCSIGFHPLHSLPAIAVYAILFVGPLLRARDTALSNRPRLARMTHLAGLGLLIHMALDGMDCLL